MPTSSQRVVALDPGERTGIAWCEVGTDGVSGIGHQVLDQRATAAWLHGAQMRAPGAPDFDVVVYETWLPRPKNGSMEWLRGDQLLSAQLVGVIRFIAWLSGAKLVGYGPDRKHVWQAAMHDDFRAAQRECTEQHDQDALMHLGGYAFDQWGVH